MLNDIHIIRYYGQRTENNNLYLFLEYAPGGELFDKIGKCFLSSFADLKIINL